MLATGIYTAVAISCAKRKPIHHRPSTSAICALFVGAVSASIAAAIAASAKVMGGKNKGSVFHVEI